MNKEQLKEFLYQERVLFYNLVKAEFERQTEEERKTKRYDKIAEIIYENML